jgi:cytoskeleton protein RodZ
MSDLVLPQSESVLAPTGAMASAGAGTMLRIAREAQGLHIAMLAVSLKVSVKKLEALEANRFDLLPDMVFVRALASSICRTLKIDEHPVLLALPPSESPKIGGVGDGLRPRFQDTSHTTHSGFRRSFSGPWGVALTLVFAAIFAIAFWPDKATIDNLMATSRVTSAAPALPPEKNFSVPEPMLAATTASAPILAAVPALLPTVVLNASPAIAAVGPLLEASNPGVSLAATNSGPLKLSAKGDSWIEVLDAGGAILLRRTLTQGESLVLSGKLPLTVVLGRADLVTVWVRDQVFDTSTFLKDNVARFEVK